MGRSVSYPSEAIVVTFAPMEPVECPHCEGSGRFVDELADDPDYTDEDCQLCGGEGTVEPDADDFDLAVDHFRDRLRELFPSVTSADDWIDREDHVLAENKLARFGMSEYCGLVAYWIVPQSSYIPRGGRFTWYDAPPMAEHWIKSIADKFVAAFGELSKVGSMSNGEGVYRRIDK